MANKLSERENEFLTQMKIEAAASNKNEQLENLNLLENYIANLPTTKDRNYAIYKVLNDPKFGFDNPDNWNVSDKSYWSDDNEKDYTPPDVEAYQRQKDGENFWNFESKNYWMNRSPKELERKALKAGYSDLGSYLNDVGKVDTYNRRNKALKDKMGVVGSFALKALYPRMTEKYMEGKDLEDRDLALDLTEQGLYAINPTDRILAAVGKTAGKGFKSGAYKLLGAAANPLVMETADKLAYGNEDTDRAKFSLFDVGAGTLINLGLGSRVDSAIKIPDGFRKNALTKDSKKLNSEWKTKYKDDVETYKVLYKEFEKANAINDLEKFFAYDKALNNLHEKIMTDKPLMLHEVNPTIAGISKDAIKEGSPRAAKDLVSYTSNKAGDLLGENPKARDRMFRWGAREIGGRTGSQFIPELVELLSSEKSERKKKIINDLLGLYNKEN